MFRLACALARALAWLWRGLWPILRALPREAATALSGPVHAPKSRDRRLLCAMAITLPIAYGVAMVLPSLTLVTTPSVDAWLLVNAPGPIRQHDYVRFILRHPVAGPCPVLITKHALCLPGDRLDLVEKPSPIVPGAWEGHYFCNDHPLGMSLPRSADGRPLDHMRWSGRIPPGMVYIGSHHPRGFDSRYFGLVPMRDLIRLRRVL